MKKRSKKGFTLIELMIVLAVIAILAIVLIPRAGSMKDSARNSGITTNVNSVRGYLETKVGNNLLTATGLRSALANNYTGNNALSNPFNNATAVATGTANVYTTALAANDAIVVNDTTTALPTDTTGLTQVTTAATISANRGTVFVYVYTNGYIVFGVDSAGNVVNAQIVS